MLRPAWTGKGVPALGDGCVEAEQEPVSFHCLLLGCGGLTSLFSVKWALINIFLINLKCSGVVGKEQKNWDQAGSFWRWVIATTVQNLAVAQFIYLQNELCRRYWPSAEKNNCREENVLTFNFCVKWLRRSSEFPAGLAPLVFNSTKMQTWFWFYGWLCESQRANTFPFALLRRRFCSYPVSGVSSCQRQGCCLPKPKMADDFSVNLWPGI